MHGCVLVKLESLVLALQRARLSCGHYRQIHSCLNDLLVVGHTALAADGLLGKMSGATSIHTAIESTRMSIGQTSQRKTLYDASQHQRDGSLLARTLHIGQKPT